MVSLYFSPSFSPESRKLPSMSVAAMMFVPSTCTVAPMRASFDFPSVTLPMMSAAKPFAAGTASNMAVATILFTFFTIMYFLFRIICPSLILNPVQRYGACVTASFQRFYHTLTYILQNLFYLRKVRISAKIFRGIDKMTIFAEEKCGYPQKSFVDYGYREK